MQRARERGCSVDVAVVPDAIVGTHWMSLDLTRLSEVLPVVRSAPSATDTSRSVAGEPVRASNAPQLPLERDEDTDPNVLDLAGGAFATCVERRRPVRTVPDAAFVGVGASARRMELPVDRASLGEHARIGEIRPESRPANENAARILRMMVLAAVIASGALWTLRQFTRSQVIVVPAPASDRSMIT